MNSRSAILINIVVFIFLFCILLNNKWPVAYWLRLWLTSHLLAVSSWPDTYWLGLWLTSHLLAVSGWPVTYWLGLCWPVTYWLGLWLFYILILRSLLDWQHSNSLDAVYNNTRWYRCYQMIRSPRRELSRIVLKVLYHNVQKEYYSEYPYLHFCKWLCFQITSPPIS